MWTVLGTLPAGIVNNGTISNTPRPEIFANWQTLSWPGNNDPDTTGPDADPDRDGTNNLLEWALGLDPNIPDGFRPAFKQGATLEYTYTRRKTAPGAATYQVEWSDGFSNDWPAAGVRSDPPISLSTSSESVRNIIPDGPDGRRFIRLKVVKP